MKKIIKIIAMLNVFLILFSITSQVFAYNKSDYAFTMGCIYSDEDHTNTSEISEKANYWYGTAGGGNKICYGLTTPNAEMLKYGAFVNGPRLMESGVIFLSGHADPSGMEWYDDNNRCSVEATTSGPTALCLNDVNLTGTSIVTFAGCNTAGGSGNNLTLKAVDRGATAALGWTTTVHIASLKNWANRYNQKLSEGKTLLEAAQYANGFIYVYDDVKNCAYAGNSSAQIKNPSNKSKSKDVSLMNEIPHLNFNEEIINFNNKESDIEYLKTLISKEYPSFNEDNYDVKVFKLDDKNYTVDFIYRVDNIKTDMGFVVTIMDNQVLQINNFMNEDSIKILNEKKELENIDLNLKSIEIENQISTEIAKDKNNSIEEESGKYVFLSEENKIFYILGVRSETNEGRIALNEVKQEIY